MIYMNIEIIKTNYNVYLDLLKKSKINKSIIRTYKLIYNLINKKYIVESYALIRMLYEEILYDLSIISDKTFSITIDTSVSKIRNKVKDNVYTLFDDTIDGDYITNIYNYLSKMTHENTIKQLLKDIVSNKKITYFLSINALFALIEIIHLYLNNIYKNDERIELVNYLLTISTFELTIETFDVNSKFTKEEIEKYSNYFVDLKDKQYINKSSDILKKDLFFLREESNTGSLQIICSRFDELIKKYNYNKLIVHNKQTNPHA